MTQPRASEATTKDTDTTETCKQGEKGKQGEYGQSSKFWKTCHLQRPKEDAPQLFRSQLLQLVANQRWWGGTNWSGEVVQNSNWVIT